MLSGRENALERKSMLCVVGCGNSTRSDDGVGVFVARALRQHLQDHPNPHVRAFDAGSGGMDVMFHARGADRLIVVDAARTGSQAGAIFKVPGKVLESVPDRGPGLHDFRCRHALAAGRKIFGAFFPTDVTVFLIEAGCLDFGPELTEPVRRSGLKVLEEILAMIQNHPKQP
jgi:hydrogenase maturation protease